MILDDEATMMVPIKLRASVSSTMRRCNKGAVIVVLAFVGISLLLVTTTKVRSRKVDVTSTLNTCRGDMPRVVQRRNYIVLPNYIPALQQLSDSVTYATHGDFTTLESLMTLTQRWQGPVSVAVYTSGQDFEVTLATIAYIVLCLEAHQVRDLVTFHLFFHEDSVPVYIPHPEQALQSDVDCTIPPSEAEPEERRQKLAYPTNAARNIAREFVNTHFFISSDMELLPSLNFIPMFLDMVRRDGQTEGPKVYVLPAYEISGGVTVPDDKTELVDALKIGDAQLLHHETCGPCHNFSGSPEWQETVGNPGEVKVFRVAKRHPPFQRWEPFFVGTAQDPFYDERLSLAGSGSKRTQAHVMCLSDYEYHILDTGFLIYRSVPPGTRRVEDELLRFRQNVMLVTVVYPSIDILYGMSPNCEKQSS